MIFYLYFYKIIAPDICFFKRKIRNCSQLQSQVICFVTPGSLDTQFCRCWIGLPSATIYILFPMKGLDCQPQKKLEEFASFYTLVCVFPCHVPTHTQAQYKHMNYSPSSTLFTLHPTLRSSGLLDQLNVAAC